MVIRSTAEQAATDHPSQSRFFDFASEGVDTTLDGLVSGVTTIAQSWCERATDYADIETLICDLPLDQWTFAVHDALAPYSGSYSMALLIRAFLIEEINGWDETALYNYLHANPSLRRKLGFETLPAFTRRSLVGQPDVVWRRNRRSGERGTTASAMNYATPYSNVLTA